MYVLGIDENGYGPILGPLVITGCLIKTEEKKNISDSKRIFRGSKGRNIGEEIVASHFSHIYQGKIERMGNFLEEILIERECFLNQRRDFCSPDNYSFPLFNDELADFKIEPLEELIDVKSIVVCPHQFNKLLKLKKKKNLVNLFLFSKVVSYFLEKYKDQPLQIICDNIGNMKDYHYFQNFLQDLKLFRLKEDKNSSQYLIIYEDKKYELRFEKRADENFNSVALASIFGKYLREIYMMKINDYFSKKIPSLPYSSGYHNRRTYEFISKTSPIIVDSDIPKTCFIREK